MPRLKLFHAYIFDHFSTFSMTSVCFVKGDSFVILIDSLLRGKEEETKHG
ncbi:hypothetical protein [Peribacillus sp. NJ4]|nr:hypothetical protein [Peribacillus sp. NJ4]